MNLPPQLDLVSAWFTRTRRDLARRIASGTALTLVAGLLVAMAVTSEGLPITKVDLNDGGVWVTKDSKLLVGRLNSQIKQLDLGVVSESSNTDVFQRAADVQLVDLGGGESRRVRLVDVAGGAAGKPVEVPRTMTTAAGRRTVAMVDSRSGKGWVLSSTGLEGFSDVATPATLDGLGQNSTVAVSADGVAFFLDRGRNAIVPVELDVNGLPVVGDRQGLGGEVGDGATMTVVGDHPVVLDAAAGVVLRPGAGSTTVDDPQGAVLQLPQGEDAGPTDVVHLATSSGLYRTGVGGGDLEKISGVDVDGVPAAPAVVDDCVYAAWRDVAASRNFEQVCEDGGSTEKIRQLSADAELVFRVNRDVIVLNDASGGLSWMVQAGMKIVDNWDTVDPRKKEKPEEIEEKQKDREKNQPPSAEDDEIFGARPGSTVVLPVTVNDTDPDGDVLTVSPNLTADGDADVRLSVVGNGTQIQARIGDNVRDEVTFSYSVSDGQPGNPEDPADVRLSIVSPEDDAKPKKFEQRENELTVARGHEGEINVMPAWYDPDGDPLVLTAASSKAGQVRFRPDGTITFVDDGKPGSNKTIDFTLSGGSAEARGKVAVSVVSPARAVPVTIADRVTGAAGSPIVIEPLTNDTDPVGGIRIPRADLQTASRGKVERTVDGDKGTITVLARDPGSYYLDYVAANDAGSAKPQVVRVDVVSSGKSNRPPVAERDTANLVSGRSALVDVLANDSDPDGDVLVVRGFADVPEGLKASLIDRRFVRVEAVAPMEAPQEVGYQVSDGENTVEGTISVSATEGDENRAPVALDDDFSVRAGTIVSLPILANDSDPDGDRLTVYGQDLSELPEDVPVVANGSTVRVLVPDVDEPSELQFSYTVRDPGQAGDSARVVLHVNPDSAEGNQRPQPSPIEARAIAGRKVRIPLNAFDSDRDGDPVSLTAVVRQPTSGRIVGQGVDWVEYESYATAAGTDTFTVQVSDQYDASGTTQVRVGVAPRSAVNQPPTALDDVLMVRPGKTIQYPVRDNDSDPDGDGFRLLPTVSTADGVEAAVVGDSVQMTSPDLDGRSERSASAQYSVTDRLGGTSTARLTLVSSALAPAYAPTAVDDTVPLGKIAGKVPGDTVEVDVLKNDGDLDGARSSLRFDPVTENATRSGRKLVLTLAKKDQVVPYRLVDRDEQESFGFVYVAGTDSVPPVLDESQVPVEVKAGDVEEISLESIIDVRDGRAPTIVRRDRIEVVRGDGKTKPSKDSSTLVFRAPKSYHGPASMTLDVTDAREEKDDTALVSQITVPITVLPVGNVPPEVRSTAIDVERGGDSVEISTTTLATDANDDTLTFRVPESVRGVEGSVDGDTIKVSAGDDAEIGDTVRLTIEVDDGSVKKPSTGTIEVTVVDSARDPMTLNDPIRVDGKAGEPTTVDLAREVVHDPFPKKAKKVSDARIVSGRSTAPAVDGTELTVTPAKGFDGVVVVAFRMSDGSGTPSRQIAGRLEVSVADVPDAPGTPTAEPEGADAVRLGWAAPDDNGKPITHYEVTWNGGEKRCEGTQCRIDGLDSGTAYRFSVVAVNEQGPSDASPKSAPVTPDVKPEQMAAPTIDPQVVHPSRDRKLDVSWRTPPDNGGSPVTAYEVEQSPGGSKRFAASKTSQAFGSLSNGTEYRFRARAVNDKGEGPWSNWSEGSTPFTKPGPVTGVSITADAPDGSGDGHVNARWNAPSDDGGDPDGIDDYTVEILKNGRPAGSKQSSGTATDFTVENGAEYSVRVKAANRAGSADEWVESTQVAVYDKASAPTNLRKKGSDKTDAVGKKGTLAFRTPADNGGFEVKSYRIETSDGWSDEVPAPTRAEGAETELPIKFTKNSDTGLRVTLTPITEPTGVGPVEGTSATSGADFKPFGQPLPPGAAGSSSGYRSTTVSWNSGDGNGRRVLATEAELLEGTRLDPVSADGTGGRAVVHTAQGGDEGCVRTRARTEWGWSEWSGRICGRADPRKVTVNFANAPDPTDNCSAKCDWVRFSVEGFAPGTYTATATQEGDGSFGYPRSFSVGGDGRGGFQGNHWYTGYNGAVIVTVDGVSGRADPPTS